MSVSFAEQVEALFQKYTVETGDKEAEIRTVASWAINNDHYDIPLEDKISRFCKEMQGVLQRATHSTPSGQRIRTYQNVARRQTNESGKTEQRYFWSDVRKASPDFVLLAFRQRHGATRCDARALQQDIQAWNESYRPADVSPIQFDFDFSHMQQDEG